MQIMQYVFCITLYGMAWHVIANFRLLTASNMFTHRPKNIAAPVQASAAPKKKSKPVQNNSEAAQAIEKPNKKRRKEETFTVSANF
jgi:hypothetical protein